jgi:signal peptidase I
MSGMWRVTVWILGVLLVLGVAARIFVLEPWTLPDENKLGASVAPTLNGGDLVLFMKRNKPAFGDLVRCKDPDDPNGFVVGRVAGMKGDHLDIVGRELSVNGRRYLGEMACKDPKVPVPHPLSGSTVEITCDQVEMAGHPHFRGWSEKVPSSSYTVDVGEGMVYLLSDDRAYHDDSRDFGQLPADTCSGRMVFRLWGRDGWGDDVHRMTFIQ